MKMQTLKTLGNAARALGSAGRSMGTAAFEMSKIVLPLAGNAAIKAGQMVGVLPSKARTAAFVKSPARNALAIGVGAAAVTGLAVATVAHFVHRHKVKRALPGPDQVPAQLPGASEERSASDAHEAEQPQDAVASGASKQDGPSGQDHTGLTLLGNNKTEYPKDYDPGLLETFENKHPDRDYMVTFRCPEFTTLCPITGQPDFATLYINYVPDERMVESKSLKLYLFSFREHGDFHEDVVNIILNDLVELMDPKYIEVRGMFYPRGGISIYPYANWARPGSKYEEIAKENMFSQLAELDRGDGARCS